MSDSPFKQEETQPKVEPKTEEIEVPPLVSSAASAPSAARRGYMMLTFALIAGLWLAIDLATKSFFNGFEVGQVIAGPFLDLFRFRLVHNTGMAWGLFGNSTAALGVMSLVVCAVLTIYMAVTARYASKVQVVGAALVVAGGLGNALDRFTLGYVVDFIDPTFIDFPVFNIADIGVTCGFVIFLIGMLLTERTREA